MVCKSIRIENFRNIGAAEVHFSPGVNVLYGDNAQGKTNLLEAVYFTALGKSFRPAKEAELIRFGAEGCRILNTFSDSLRTQTLSYRLSGGRGRRLVEQNGVRVTRMSDMVGAFRVVLFCPEHLSLIQGGPELRRGYLNVALSQLRPVYLRALQRYNQILKERNSLLRRAPEDMATFRATEPMWSAQLAHEAALIAAMRDVYISRVNRLVAACFSDMTEDGEVPELTYVNSLGLTGEALTDRAEVEARYLSLLSTRHDREIGAGATLWGIHKDDIAVTLNGRPARQFASQGQQRSLALAMKLAEGEISAQESGGDRPVFLFDDVLSELDSRRRAYLMGELEGRQVIMTTCDPSASGIATDRVHTIRVVAGRYEESGE
ncbi:MAG: DNA replication/repair protein RecF [Eubacteriales bacterium]